MVIAVFAIFLSILFTVNLINNYEQAAARIDAKKSYLELDNKLTNMKTDSDIFDVMFKNVTLNSTQFWVDTSKFTIFF